MFGHIAWSRAGRIGSQENCDHRRNLFASLPSREGASPMRGICHAMWFSDLIYRIVLSALPGNLP
jgi:hypothetical protein